MPYNTKVIIWTAGLVLFSGALLWWIDGQHNESTKGERVSESSKVVFTCDSQKSIAAIFRDGLADIELSNGRHELLKPVVAASGARYTDNDTSLVFWNKGNTALIIENDSVTFKNCVIKGENDLTNLKTYSGDGFRFRYPRIFKKYRENASDTAGWSYASSRPGRLIIQLRMDTPVQRQTNLAEATFTIGRSDKPNEIRNCMHAPPVAGTTDTLTTGGATYIRSRYEEAGAGNYYQIVRYRFRRKNSCYSVEEMVHSTNIYNYPPERGITEFDSSRVWKALSVPFQTLAFHK